MPFQSGLWATLAVVLLTLASTAQTINVNSDALSLQSLSLPSRSLQGRDCSSTPVPPCAKRGNRDIVFLVDASDSMSPSNFYGQMLDFVQTAFCAFDSADTNRAAMITFARQIVTRIPLAKYSAAQWFNKVDLVRDDSTVCCSCCTPTAEAFRAARIMLTENPPTSDDTLRVVLMISDGNPWQNTDGLFSVKSQGPATYTYLTAPRQAQMLKDLGGQKDVVRLLFLGTPDKWGKSADFGFFKGTNIPGKRKCITRRRRTECVKIPETATYYPITSQPADKYVMVSNTWEVADLVNIVSDNLCRPVSDVPTASPTPRPTPIRTNAPTTKRPTNQPTASPTEKRRFDGLDLYIFLDRSRSMRWRYRDCRAAPGGNPAWPQETACWQLFLGFAEKMATKSSQLKPLTRGSAPSAVIGWQDDHADKTKGLRVWVYGFACADQQSTPLVFRLGEKVSNATAFNQAMAAAASLIPDGGTCPGAAFERSLGMVMANDLLTRPWKAALLFTDGVFYDQPRPALAAKGLNYLGVFTYALGISIPTQGNDAGLTPAEIADQRKQLLAFVNGDATRFVNFDQRGYNALEAIASGFVNRLPADVEANLPNIEAKPYWCGFTNDERCLSTNPETFDTSKYCKWIPDSPSNPTGNGRCMDKIWCNWSTRASCAADRFCSWSSNRCSYNGTP